MTVPRRATNLLLILALVASGGCAAWPQMQAPVPDVKPARKARSAQLVKEYSQHRDEAQYQAALSAWNQGNTETCRELIDTLLERTPEHRNGRLLLIQMHLLEQELVEARTAADKLAKDFPADAEVLHEQGLVCEASGDVEQAARCYRRAVQIDPKNETYATSLAGIADSDGQDSSETRRSQRQATATAAPESDRLSAALLRAEVSLALGEADAARRLVEEALAQMPSQAELESLLARICRQTGDATDAMAHSRRAADLRAGRKVQPASYAAGSKRPGQADDDSESIAGDKKIPRPNWPATSASAARSISSKSAESSRAQASVEELLRHGEAALATDAPAAARGYFQRAIAAAPDDENVAVSAAVAALRHNHPELAAQLAQSALPHWPKSAVLYRTLGMAEYRLEHWQAAQAALRQALSLDNSQALSYFLLGCTLSKLGQDQEAERNFSQARQLDTRYVLKP